MGKRLVFNLQRHNQGNTELAVKTGENSADIDNLEETVEKIEEKIEHVENQAGWTQADINHLYARISDLETKYPELLSRLEALEAVPTVKEVEETSPPIVAEETELEKPPTQKKSKKKGRFGLW